MNCELCHDETAEYEVLMSDLEIYFIGEKCLKDREPDIIERYKLNI